MPSGPVRDTRGPAAPIWGEKTRAAIGRAAGRYRPRGAMSIRRRALFFPGKMRDYLLAEQAQRMHDLLVCRRTDGAQQDHFVDPHRLVKLDKADALFRCADAEFCALCAHVLRGRLAGM